MFGQSLEQPHPSHASAVLIGEDQVIQNGQVDGLASACQFARGTMVGIARARIATRMIVGDDHASTAEPQRIRDNLAHRQANRGGAPGILFDVDAARRAVDMRDQQMLARAILTIEAGHKEAARCLMAVEHRS